MASYQNTNEYYCGINMDSYPQHYTDPSVYFEQNPSNFQVHNQVYPVLPTDNSIYEPSGRQVVYHNSQYYGNLPQQPAPQYPLTQYTPLPPPGPVSYPVFHLGPRPYQNNNCMAKRHRAQITILPSSKGNFKAVVKRKRKRTMFTTEQVEALEEIFKRKQYVSREERQLIVNNLQINDKAVKIWFQNRRLKTKRVQDQDSDEQEDCSNVSTFEQSSSWNVSTFEQSSCSNVSTFEQSSSSNVSTFEQSSSSNVSTFEQSSGSSEFPHSEETRSSLDLTRLDAVESAISKKTDEYGFVTLDDGVMGDLTNVIDDFLTKSSVQVPVEDIVGNDISPNYEPVSPPSFCDGNEEDNFICWKPSEPKESLQRLLDLKSMLTL